jgi:flagellar basal-body rod protein FlgB
MSFLSSIAERGAGPALEATMAFSEAKLSVLAENVANVQTPGFRAKQLDAKAFQRALREAVEDRGGDYRKPLIVNNRGEVRTDALGRLRFRPTQQPAGNVLFHDGTNASLEKQMADLAETGMAYEMSASFLRARFDGLRKAIRGTSR